MVAVGPVGLVPLGRLRLFRYEVRCWPGGRIPDVAWAVESPRRLSDDEVVASRVLTQVSTVPTLTWGRDDLGLGDMWNSNSLVAWLLSTCGLDAAGLRRLAGAERPDGAQVWPWPAGLPPVRRVGSVTDAPLAVTRRQARGTDGQASWPRWR